MEERWDDNIHEPSLIYLLEDKIQPIKKWPK